MKDIYRVKKTTTNNRLAEMGVIKGTLFRIVKKVFGMIQIRFSNNDLVIREDLFEDIEYEDNK